MHYALLPVHPLFVCKHFSPICHFYFNCPVFPDKSISSNLVSGERFAITFLHECHVFKMIQLILLLVFSLLLEHHVLTLPFHLIPVLPLSAICCFYSLVFTLFITVCFMAFFFFTCLIIFSLFIYFAFGVLVFAVFIFLFVSICVWLDDFIFNHVFWCSLTNPGLCMAKFHKPNHSHSVLKSKTFHDSFSTLAVTSLLPRNIQNLAHL